MAGVKRPSDGQPSTAKRSCPNKEEQDIILKDQLEAMEKVELIAHILKLQTQIVSAAQAPPNSPATPGFSEEEVYGKASKARELMEKGIKSQMKVSLT